MTAWTCSGELSKWLDETLGAWGITCDAQVSYPVREPIYSSHFMLPQSKEAPVPWDTWYLWKAEAVVGCLCLNCLLGYFLVMILMLCLWTSIFTDDPRPMLSLTDQNIVISAYLTGHLGLKPGAGLWSFLSTALQFGNTGTKLNCALR